MDKYEVIIGLEVHAQLQTASKIFNSDAAEFGNDPNTQVGVITLGHPGTLPVLNKKAVEYAIKMGLACDSEIASEMIFDRKNYFYPDLPKGYQITQDRTPICNGGTLTITLPDACTRQIQLNRIHLEEDAGKSIHTEDVEHSLVDFNRSGVPLIEIVTEPCLHSADEAHALLMEIRRLVRYLEICDGNMEEGSLRCDANISLMPRGSNTLGNKVEIKNLNSMKHVQRAINHEIERQLQLLENEVEIVSETRNYDPVTGQTSGMRTKEALNDYRYFPDPDLSPVQISDKWLTAIKKDMPALPRQLEHKFLTVYKLPAYDIGVLIETKEMAAYYEEVATHSSNYKSISNWLMGPIKSYLNDNSIRIEALGLHPKRLADIIELVDQNSLSYSMAAQRLFPEALNNERDVAILAEELNLLQDKDEDSLGTIVDAILKDFPDKVEAYQSGKKGLIGMFMGELMKRSGGKADPKKANELLQKKLG